MNELKEENVSCPYCGETIQVLLDNPVSEQEYIEDCQVCCRPINFYMSLDLDGEISLRVAHEDEV